MRTRRLSAILATSLLSLAIIFPGVLGHAAGDPSIVTAARNDDMTAVRAQIAKRANVNELARDGSTALLWAVYNGNLEMTRALLAAGAPVNAPNHYGITPLLQASRTGDAPLIGMLLKAGADVAAAHPDGETPLMAASRTGHIDARQAAARGRRQREHRRRVSAGNRRSCGPRRKVTPDVVKTLLEAGADPNRKAHVNGIDERKHADHPTGGFTALMFAARNGHDDVAAALIKGGADPKLTNGDGLTATMVAIVERPVRPRGQACRSRRRRQRRLALLRRRHARRDDRHARARRLAAARRSSEQADVDRSGQAPARQGRRSEQAVRGPGALHDAVLRPESQQLAVLSRRDRVGRRRAEADARARRARSSGARPRSRRKAAAAAGRGANANVGKTPMMVAMTGGRGAAFAAGPGFDRIGPPPFREAAEPRSARGDQGAAGGRRRSERQGAGRLDAAAPGGHGAAGADHSRAGRGRREARRGQQGQPDAAAAGRKAGAGAQRGRRACSRIRASTSRSATRARK